MKFKKIGLTLGSITAVAIPVSAVIACGSSSAPLNRLTKMADVNDILSKLAADKKTKYSFKNKTDEEKKEHVKELMEKFFGDISPKVIPELWKKVTDNDYILKDRDSATFDYLGRLLSKIPFKGGGPAKDHTLTIGSGSFIPGYEENMIALSEGHFKSIISNSRFASTISGKEIKTILKDQLELNNDAMKIIDDLAITLAPNDTKGELHIKFKYDGDDKDIKVGGFAGYKTNADILAESKYKDITKVVEALKNIVPKKLELTGTEAESIKALLGIQISSKEKDKGVDSLKTSNAKIKKAKVEDKTPIEKLAKLGITIPNGFDYKGTKVTFSTFGINHDGKLIIEFEVSNKLKVIPNDSDKKDKVELVDGKFEKEFKQVVYKEVDVTGIDKYHLDKFVKNLTLQSFINKKAKGDKKTTYVLPWINSPNFSVNQVTDAIIVQSLKSMMKTDFRITDKLKVSDLEITRNDAKGELSFKFKGDYKTLNSKEFKWTGFKTNANNKLDSKNKDYRYLNDAVKALHALTIKQFKSYVAPVSITKTKLIDEDVAKEWGITLPENWKEHKIQASYYTTGSYTDGSFMINFIVSHKDGKLPLPEINNKLFDKNYQIDFEKLALDKMATITTLLAKDATTPVKEKDAYKKTLVDEKAKLDKITTSSNLKNVSAAAQLEVKKAKLTYENAIKEANTAVFEKLDIDIKKLAKGKQDKKQIIFNIYSPTELIYGASLDQSVVDKFKNEKLNALGELDKINDFANLDNKFKEVKEAIDKARDEYQKAITNANKIYEVDNEKRMAKRKFFVWNSLKKLSGGAESPTSELDSLKKAISDANASIDSLTTKEQIEKEVENQTTLIKKSKNDYDNAVESANKIYTDKKIPTLNYLLTSKQVTTFGLAKEAVDRLINGLKVGQKKNIFVRFPSSYPNSPDLQNVMVYFDVTLNEMHTNKGVSIIDDKTFVKLLFDTLYANPQRGEKPKLPASKELMEYILKDDKLNTDEINDKTVLAYLKNLNLSLNIISDKKLVPTNKMHVLRGNSVDGNKDNPNLLNSLFGFSYDALKFELGKFTSQKYKYSFKYQLKAIENPIEGGPAYNLEIIFYKKAVKLKVDNKFNVPIFEYNENKKDDYAILTKVVKNIAQQKVSFIMNKDADYKPSSEWKELKDYKIFGESYIKSLPKKTTNDDKDKTEITKDDRLDKWLKSNSTNGYKVEYKFTNKLKNNSVNGIILRLSKNGISLISNIPYYNWPLNSIDDLKSKLGDSWNYQLEKLAQNEQYKLIMQKVIEASKFDLANKSQIAHIFNMLGKPKNYQEFFQKQKQAVYMVKLYLITNKIVRDLAENNPNNEYLKKITSVDEQHKLVERIAFANALSVDEYIKRTGMTGEDLAFRNNYNVLREYFEKTLKVFATTTK